MRAETETARSRQPRAKRNITPETLGNVRETVNDNEQEKLEHRGVKYDGALYSKLTKDMQISNGAFRLWHLLRDHAGNKGFCWPGVRCLVRELHSSTRSIETWLEQLQKEGYIVVESGNRNTTNTYTLATTPAGCEANKQAWCVQKENTGVFKRKTELTEVNQRKRTRTGNASPKHCRGVVSKGVPNSAKEVFQYCLNRYDISKKASQPILNAIEARFPVGQILEELYKHDQITAANAVQLAARFLQFNNDHGWCLNGTPITSWRAILAGFAEFCLNTGVSDVSASWIPDVSFATDTTTEGNMQ